MAHPVQCWCMLDLATYFNDAPAAAAEAAASAAGPSSAAGGAAGQAAAAADSAAAEAEPAAQGATERQQGPQGQRPPDVLLSSGVAQSESSELQLSPSEEAEMQLGGPLAQLQMQLSGPHLEEALGTIPMERHPSLVGEEQKRELAQHAQQGTQHSDHAEQQAAGPPASPPPGPVLRTSSSRLSRRSLPRAGGGEVLQDVWLPLVDPGDASRVCGRVRVSVRATSIETLEQQLWRRLLPIVDMDGDGLLTRNEFSALLEVSHQMMAEVVKTGLRCIAGVRRWVAASPASCGHTEAVRVPCAGCVHLFECC